MEFSTKILMLYQKIKTPQTDPNAMKHEINQYKYFTHSAPNTNYVRGGSYQKVKKLSPLIGVMMKFKVY